jgi:high-affinity iron transporter
VHRLRWRITALAVALIVAPLFLVSPAFADGDTQSLLSTVSTMIQRTRDAQSSLSSGNVDAARAAGDSVEQSWESIERAVAERSPRAESQVDEALDHANEALKSDPPAPDAATRLDQLQSALTALSQALQTGASAPAPSSEQATIGEGIRLLRDADTALDAGNIVAAKRSFDAFRELWPMLETRVLVQSPDLYHKLEAQMTAVESSLSASPPDSATANRTVEQMTVEMLSLVSQEEHYGPFDAAITLLREGLEALLIVGALLALVTRSGRPDLRWQVWAGAGAGVLASLAVAALLQVVFSHFAVGLNREMLEGVTGLGAAAMLLYVSYWLHQQSSLDDWRKFLASRTGAAIASGNFILLPSLAFLAVFREGAETILLYAGMVAAISLRDLILGMAIGLVALIGIGVALFGFGLRLSLKPFFRVISVLLYYLAFKFVGTGIHALQVAGALPATSADYLPSLGMIGIFPTWQTTVAQALLVAAAVITIAWLAAIQRSRGIPAK